MRCWHSPTAHAPEDCPGSGPAGWEVERADRSGALPLAQAGSSDEQRAESPEQGSGPARRVYELNEAMGNDAAAPPPQPPFSPASADDELDQLVRFKEGRGEVQSNPPAGLTPGSPPISLFERRQASPRPTPLHAGKRTRAAEELFETLGAACARAAGTGVQMIEVDWMDISALMLHAAALEEGLAYAAANHGCEGGDCAWADEMNRVMDGVLS